MFKLSNAAILTALLTVLAGPLSSSDARRISELDNLRGKIEEAGEQFASTFGQAEQQLLGAHPLANGVHKVVETANKIRQGLHEGINKIHEELVAGRKELAHRLADYEEGSFNFSSECALLSFKADDCNANSDCNFCLSDKLQILKIDGICAAAKDEDMLSNWGMTCGTGTTVKELLMEEFDITSVETEALEEDELTEEEMAGAANLGGMMMISEVAYEQESSEEAPIEEEALETGEFDKFCVEQDTLEECGGGKDEDGNPCVWCKYNSWLGTCVTANDKDVATSSFAMTCGASFV